MDENLSDNIFKFVIANPECRLIDIAKGVGLLSNNIIHKVNSLVVDGLLVKKELHGNNVYTCSVNEKDIELLFTDEFNKSISGIYNYVKSSGSKNPLGLTKQILSAYVDLYESEEK